MASVRASVRLELLDFAEVGLAVDDLLATLLTPGGGALVIGTVAYHNEKRDSGNDKRTARD